ncbi:MAG: ABC transporter permease [Defluviitaleaceae bacterium]|nr:ABC transporter permease [Defluviitaleaceae bacterium]
MIIVENPKGRLFADSWTMFCRCLRITLRNPDAFANAIIVPAAVMLLFGLVFGNIMDVGSYSYIDFIVPGIILQTVAQGAVNSAISVNNDMTKGIMDRFRSMPIAKSAVLTGHVMAAVVRSIITTTVAIGIAIAIGFRPQAGFVDWLIIAGVLVLFMLFVTWIAVICGLIAKSPESAGGYPFLLFLLPYVSSGFAPIETLPSGIRWFAQHQPMTPIIDSVRALMLGTPPGDALPLALIWSIGIIIVSYVVAVQIYKRKFS